MEHLPPEIVPFAKISGWAITYVLASHFFGFFVRGAFGFGSNLPIVVLTTWLLGPHHAIMLVIITATIAQLYLFPQGLKTADWRIAFPLVVGMLAGTAIGAWLFAWLASSQLTLLLAITIATVVLLDRFKLIEAISAKSSFGSPFLIGPLSIISGTVGTLSGGGAIYLLVSYLKFACSTPSAFRGTNIAISGIFVIGRMFFVALFGLISPNMLSESLILLPFVFLGVLTGTRFFRSANPGVFYSALQLLLLGAAAMLIGQVLMKEN